MLLLIVIWETPFTPSHIMERSFSQSFIVGHATGNSCPDWLRKGTLWLATNPQYVAPVTMVVSHGYIIAGHHILLLGVEVECIRYFVASHTHTHCG